MKRELRGVWGSALVLGGAMLLVPIVGLSLLAWSWQRSGDRVGAPAASPDGKYVLLAQVRHSFTDMSTNQHIEFLVSDARGHVLDQHLTDATPTQGWAIAWDAQDRVWLSSNATGGHAWEQATDGKWHKVPDEKLAALKSPWSG